ncbi:MAG TPA: histidine kinase [Steroidobacteraceae bacterium]|nr:histidine kinase [Steroidobacteraceae bacterium]
MPAPDAALPSVSAALPESDDTTRVYWLCQLGGWGAFCGFQAWSAIQVLGIPVNIAIGDYALYMVLLISATHLLRGYSKRHRWAHLPTAALVRQVLIANIVLSAAIVIAIFLLVTFLSFLGIQLIFAPNQTRPFAMGLAFLNTQVFLLFWMTSYFGFSVLRQRQSARAEEARLRAALRTAELSLLKSQLNPHFLFNALNTVRALIAESPQRAELAVTQLARTLRYSLNSSRDELVTLEHEMDIVKDYLGIETLRLAERLTIVQEVSAAALKARMPIMLLQTLVENAVKHGISQLAAGGTLDIKARMDGSILVIEVCNDRPTIKNNSIPSDKVGLTNANDRLRLMIGSNASLALDLNHPQRAKATVRIPQSEAK